MQQSLDGWTIAFLVIELFAIVIGVITSKEAVSNGVRFDESKIEFTGLDDNNIFEYAEIEKIETALKTQLQENNQELVITDNGSVSYKEVISKTLNTTELCTSK